MQQGMDLKKAKKGMLIVAVIGILTVGAIIGLTFNVDTLSALKKIDVIYLGLAVVAVLVSWLFSALAFYVLARAVKRPLSLAESSSIYLGGSFFGLLTPFGSGLLPTQVYILTSQGFSPGQATAVASSRVTISSWLFAMLAFIVFVLFGKSLPGSTSVNLLLGIALVATAWSVLTLFFIKKPENAKNIVMRILGCRVVSRLVKESRLNKIKGKIYDEIEYLSSNLRDLFSRENALVITTVFLIEVVAWFALFAVLPLVLFGFGVKGSLAQLLFRLFLLFSLIPASPTPGGSGVVELAFTGLLYDLIPSHIIGLIVLTWRALTYYLTLFVGGVVALRFIAKTAFSGENGAGVKDN